MIEVTIDLVSALSGKRSTIGTVVIVNDGSGTRTTGHYNIRLLKRGSHTQNWRTGRVTDFPRQARGPYDLLHLALVACGIPERVPRATATAAPIEEALDDLCSMLRTSLASHKDPAGAVRRLIGALQQTIAKTPEVDRVG